MRPLACNAFFLYRKHQVGVEDQDGYVVSVTETDGPYVVAIIPGHETRTRTDKGYVRSEAVYKAVASDTHDFEAGDILSDGRKDLYVIDSVATFGSHQQMEVRKA